MDGAVALTGRMGGRAGCLAGGRRRRRNAGDDRTESGSGSSLRGRGASKGSSEGWSEGLTGQWCEMPNEGSSEGMRGRVNGRVEET